MDENIKRGNLKRVCSRECFSRHLLRRHFVNCRAWKWKFCDNHHPSAMRTEFHCVQLHTRQLSGDAQPITENLQILLLYCRSNMDGCQRGSPWRAAYPTPHTVMVATEAVEQQPWLPLKSTKVVLLLWGRNTTVLLHIGAPHFSVYTLVAVTGMLPLMHLSILHLFTLMLTIWC